MYVFEQELRGEFIFFTGKTFQDFSAGILLQLLSLKRSPRVARFSTDEIIHDFIAGKVHPLAPFSLRMMLGVVILFCR